MFNILEENWCKNNMKFSERLSSVLTRTFKFVSLDCNDDDSCEDTETDPCDDGGCDYDSDSDSGSDDCNDSDSCEDDSSSSDGKKLLQFIQRCFGFNL